MPVYNAEKYIEQFLQNLDKQTFGNYELLILDALSSDNTKAIVEENQTKDSRIRLVTEKDDGIYEAMNKGIQLAKGEWIYFMGCDDNFFDPEVLQKISVNLNANYDLVYGDVLWVPDQIPEQGECEPKDLLNRNINHQRIFYRRELFLQFGNYDLQYQVASDHELNIRFFCNDAIRKKYIPVTIANYHSGGFSANKTDHIFWQNWKQIFQKNFAAHLPQKEMYVKLGWYCRQNIDQHQYTRAFGLFWDVFLHTLSPGFVLLTLKQLIQSFRKEAN